MKLEKTAKKCSSLLLILLMVMSLSLTAFAGEPSVTFKGLAEGFEFQTGSQYTASDLFDGFKNVIPGDHLSEIIQIKNAATDCNYIKLYMKVVVHDEYGNPLTYSESAENADGKDQANIDNQRDETVATMQDFLSRLTMRIYNGAQLIYEASPDKAGALADHVFLGDLRAGETSQLKVELDVPAELDNKYANCVGEADWVFLAEGIEYEKLTVHKVWDDNGNPERPDSVDVRLLRDGRLFETVSLSKENQWTFTWDGLDDQYSWTVEEETVKGYEVSYKIKDNTVFIINHNDYIPVPAPKPVDLTVKKVWSDENNKNGSRPDFVTVTLFDGDHAVEKVTLNARNNWSYRWENLNGSGNWSVVETGIPKGYTPSYYNQNGVVTITNTASLIHTGQLNWPVPVMSILGLVLIVYGVMVIARKRKDKHA